VPELAVARIMDELIYSEDSRLVTAVVVKTCVEFDELVDCPVRWHGLPEVPRPTVRKVSDIACGSQAFGLHPIADRARSIYSNRSPGELRVTSVKLREIRHDPVIDDRPKSIKIDSEINSDIAGYA